MVFTSWRCLKWAFRYTGLWRTSCHTRQGHDGAMDGELRIEAAVERSTITSKPGVETLARTAISPRGGSRAHQTAQTLGEGRACVDVLDLPRPSLLDTGLPPVARGRPIISHTAESGLACEFCPGHLYPHCLYS